MVQGFRRETYVRAMLKRHGCQFVQMVSEFEDWKTANGQPFELMPPHDIVYSDGREPEGFYEPGYVVLLESLVEQLSRPSAEQKPAKATHEFTVGRRNKITT